jgi:Putative  PD-(D/E)XK family member, (DUF4420)
MSRCEELWNELHQHAERPVFRRVDESHPADLYAGIDDSGRLELMLVCNSAVAEVPLFEALRVSQNLRQDGRYALVVRLEQGELKAAFARVCDDLSESLRRAPLGSDLGATLVGRLNRWRRLLEAGRTKGLTESELRGLIGELLVLEQLISSRGAAAAVKSWVGPHDAPQDFDGGGILIEVKACRAGSNAVAISSLQQLSSSNTPIFLIVVFLSPASEWQDKSFSIRDIVGRIRAVLEPFPSELDDFNIRLYHAGFSDEWEGNKNLYTREDLRSYLVDEKFPKIIPASVPAGIIRALYTVDLSFCGACERNMPWTEIWN